MVSKAKKIKLIEQFGGSKTNSGAPQVQIAILTAEIEELKKHFDINPKDIHSKRGFLAKIEKRKKLLTYLRRYDLNIYQDTIKKLDLRK